MAPLIAVVDTGPLLAAADDDDIDHEACLEVFSRPDIRFVIPGLVIAEATYMVGTRLGSPAEAAFLKALAPFDNECPTDSDLDRMAHLVTRYADFPLGGTDAFVVALAERLEAKTIVTLDRRHFESIRPSHVRRFELLP